MSRVAQIASRSDWVPMLGCQCGSPKASYFIELKIGRTVDLFLGHLLKMRFISDGPERCLAGRNIGNHRWWMSDSQGGYVKVLSHETKRVPDSFDVVIISNSTEKRGNKMRNILRQLHRHKYADTVMTGS